MSRSPSGIFRYLRRTHARQLRKNTQQPDRRRTISPIWITVVGAGRYGQFASCEISSIDGLLWPNNTMPHSLRNLLARSRAHRIDPKMAQGVFFKVAIALAGSKSSIPANQGILPRRPGKIVNDLFVSCFPVILYLLRGRRSVGPD